jgi:Tfp pilus assembly protein FimT
MTFGERFAGRRQMGFSTTELIVVCGILGLLAAVSVPFFVTYYQSAALKAATEEVAALLNQGRQVAIKENQSVCVQTASTSIRLRVNGCAGTVWVGPGTDASGNFTIATGFTLASSASPIFSYLGAAAPAATFTVTNTADGRTLTVALSASGRVAIGP